MNKILHLTTVHPAWDNRIYYKMVLGLINNGYDVTYVAKEDKEFSLNKNIKYYPLVNNKGLLWRLIRNIQALCICLKNKKHILHFHDPENIIIAAILKIAGMRVIYDVHEDNELSLKHKNISPMVKPILRKFIVLLDKYASKKFDIIIAEKIYKVKFPTAYQVLNYPKQNICKKKNKIIKRFGKKNIYALYTGNINEQRGAINHVNLLNKYNKLDLTMIGKCPDYFKKYLINLAGENSKRLNIISNEKGIHYNEIENYYISNNWNIGLALFPYSPHYYQKELTKFFEYIQYNIPILCSNFPVWKKLVETNRLGYIYKCDMNILKYINYNTNHFRYLSNYKYDWKSQLKKIEVLYNV
jgi:hypothetical protein